MQRILKGTGVSDSTGVTLHADRNHWSWTKGNMKIILSKICTVPQECMSYSAVVKMIISPI